MNYVEQKLFMAKLKMMNFLTNERGEVNIVTMVVMIGIAVTLAILFKNQITGLLTTLLGGIEDNAKAAVGVK